jgi:hypothetical protein
MKKLLITLLLLALTATAQNPLDLLIIKINLPVKKSKIEKVRAVTYDVWGPDADEWGRHSGITGTNWADQGYQYFTVKPDNTQTVALYCVTFKQTKYRATPEKRKEWKLKIDGGMGVEIIVTNSLAAAIEHWNLEYVTNGIPE